MSTEHSEQTYSPAGQTVRTPAWRLLRIWAGIGLQSFGGGASTLLLIRLTFVERRGLIGADELGRFWSLCQFTPGINLIALTILIGRKLGGTRGIVASVAGMLVPSAAVTCVLAAGFTAIEHPQWFPGAAPGPTEAAVHAILRGIIPATAGIMGVVALGYVEPLLQRARKEGAGSIAANAVIMAGSAIALIVARLSVAAVLVCVALLGAAIFTRWSGPTPVTAAPEVPKEEASQ